MNRNNQQIIKELCKAYKSDVKYGDIPNESFAGPSSYFSQEALKACKNDFLGERHIEMVYATLVSWGMHRSGKGGAKMPKFSEYKESIVRNRVQLDALKGKHIERLTRNEFEEISGLLKKLCFGENGSVGSCTKSRIVSSSKTLAHILPDLVPPIDRQYTASFFGYNKNNISFRQEKELFDRVMHIIYELYQTKDIVECAKKLINDPLLTLPKLFDNVLIALQNEKNC